MPVLRTAPTAPRRARRSAPLLAALVLGACAGDTPAPFQPATGAEAARRYWALTLDHSAITLSTAAPYHEIQLTATPRDALGAPLADLGPATFRSTDPELVVVTPDGLVQALGTATGLQVIAELTAGGVRHADTVWVTATSEPQPLQPASLSIHPEPPDSTVWAVGGAGTLVSIPGTGIPNLGFPLKLLAARVTDANGAPMPEVAVDVVSSDTTVAAALRFGGAQFALAGLKPGRVTLTASATAYGVALTDTVAFTITMPVYAVVRIVTRSPAAGVAPQPVFAAADVTVSPGGTVVWANVSGTPVDVVFDDPTNVAEHGAVSCANARVVDPGGVGDVEAFGEPQDPAAPLSAGNCRSRGFPVPGVYPYRSTLTGAIGRVVVGDGLAAP